MIGRLAKRFPRGNRRWFRNSPHAPCMAPGRIIAQRPRLLDGVRRDENLAVSVVESIGERAVGERFVAFDPSQPAGYFMLDRCRTHHADKAIQSR